jgi:IS5 family transposase
MSQIEIVNLEDLVNQGHNYRKFLKLWDLGPVNKKLESLKSSGPYEGYGIERLFLCLLLQFMEDLSDRELEKYLEESISAKWFCGFTFMDKTPEFSLFSKIRARIGTSLLSSIFEELKKQLRSSGYLSEVFTFIDATHLISKANLWKERDEAIKKKYDKLNNDVLPKVAHDKQARIGCKGKDKFWYGFKKHVSVDMQSGLINKVAITEANLTDAKGFKHVCPSGGAVYSDKGYCVKPSVIEAKRRGVHLAAIKKNNMKGKNADLDKYYSRLRSPYERVFSKENKRVRYLGIAKNQFAAFMTSICFNLKRLIVLDNMVNAVT